MSFTHPEAFWFVLALALFVAVAVRNYKKKRTLLKGFVSEAAYKKLGVRSGGEIDFFKTALTTLALLFFILALAGPQWGEKIENLEIKGIEMLFLMDASTSMNAEDLKPNRLEVAKQLVINVMDNLRTDYVGLINFAGGAYVQCPLTIDYDAFKLMTEASFISPDEEQGTDFSEAFRLALKTFKASKEEQRLMILITDGEDQEKTWQQFLPAIKDQNITIFTVGIGAAGGAPIPVKDDQGNIKGWKKDKSGEIVKTKLDEDTLVKIASETGGQYFRLADVTASEIFIDYLKNFERTVLRKKVKKQKIKRFHIPLIIGIIILLLELLLSERTLSWKEKK